MELFEVYDRNGKSTHRIERRDIVHREGLWHRTVHVWIYNRRKEILFQLRAQGKDSHPGLWDVSAAGHIGFGEKPEKTALREIYEELGLSVRPQDLQYVKETKQTMISRGGTFIDNEITFIYLHAFNGELQDLYPNQEEVEAIRFFTVNELKKILEDPFRKKAFVPYDKEYYSFIIKLIQSEL